MKKVLYILLSVFIIFACIVACDDNASKSKITPVTPIGPEEPEPVIVNNYITFKSSAPFSIVPSYEGSGLASWDGQLFYSTNTKDWIEFPRNAITTATSALTEGSHYLYFRGLGNNVITMETPFALVATSDITCSGNIMNLLDYEQVEQEQDIIMDDKCFSYMFNEWNYLTDVTELKLPALTLSDSCYLGMFMGTKIITAPELPATNLANNCYESMFDNCTNLKNAPTLNATNMQDSCYWSMFSSCTSLETAPALPATNLAGDCYLEMFSGCTSLTSAPELPATTLASACYKRMFSGCTNLNKITVSFTNWNDVSDYDSYSTKDWVEGVASSGDFYCPAALDTTTNSDIYVPTGWTVHKPGTPGPSPTTSTNYLKFTASTGSVSVTPSQYWNATTKEYSTDGGSNWNNYTSGQVVGSTSSIMFRGLGGTSGSGDDQGSETWDISGSNVSVSGDIMTLLNYSNPTEATMTDYCFYEMFTGQTSLVSASELIISATNMSDGCYGSMFENCTNLVTAPELPATNLAKECYSSMFKNCTSLATAPILPATILQNYCYQSMFSSCTSLVTAPALSATTLAKYCYDSMFENCTSLTTASALPATILQNYCYQSMFSSCTSLVTAPALSATTLATDCCRNMFSDCTSLTSVPALPATTMISSCYKNMFLGCTSLVTAPDLPATTLAQSCYESMFYGCTSLVTAPALPATSLVNYCYSFMFYGCSNLNKITVSFTDWTASYPAVDWVKNVSATGDFYCPACLIDTSTADSSHIPENWTVHGSGPTSATNGLKFIADTGSVSVTPSTYWNASEKYYSTDNGLTWNTYSSGAIQGNTVMFCGFNGNVCSDREESVWNVSGSNVSVSGDIMTLLNYSTPTEATMGELCFDGMFQDQTSITTASDLILSAETLSDYCYEYMFCGCENLTGAPVLSATNLTTGCYQSMFQGTKLTEAPDLPATTLAEYCYCSMFYECASLVKAPYLPATYLPTCCYSSMFEKCSSLKISTSSGTLFFTCPDGGNVESDAKAYMFEETYNSEVDVEENTTYYWY